MSHMTPSDHWIPWYFVIFFAILATVNGVMVTLAVTTHSGLVTDHPYERGLAYNQVVKAAEMQAARGWTGQLDYGGGILRFTLRDAKGTRLQPTEAHVTFTRPLQQGEDFHLPLKQGQANVRFPAPGQWAAHVEARYDGLTYQHSQRIIVP